MKYVLFVDSDCDVTLEEAKSYGAEFISMPYSEDDKEIYPYVDWKEFDHHHFYDRLRHGKMSTTSALNAENYKAYFRPFFEKGLDILYAHFSSAMSASFGYMQKGVEELLEEFPERKFYEIDAKGITIGAYSLIREIMKRYKEGYSAEQLVKYGEDNVQKFAVYFFADNLKFFARSGRVKGITALMGNIFGVRPLIYMNEEGKMVSIGKAKGRTKALEALVQYVEDLGEDLKDYPVVIASADNEELSHALGDMIKEKFGEDIHIDYLQVNPTAGAHCGPDTVGISFRAKHR